MEKKSNIGLVGLAVMGANLALNMLRNGFSVSVYNHTPQKTDLFMKENGSNQELTATYALQQFVDSLECPRKIFLMIKAGEPVDEMIEALCPLLDKGDVIIDGGNSYYKDTERRCKYVASQGKLLIGCGVSGGEEGALWGPSLMPGGMYEAWPLVCDMLKKIAATSPDGTPCCEWIGPGGAGHFVKMIHNGIEYGDMQLIAETYMMLKQALGYNNEQMARVFDQWNNEELSSYLIEITAKVLKYKEADGGYLIDKILDTAGQKGTGKWSVESALSQGVSLSVIAEAVFERQISAEKIMRVYLSEIYKRQSILPKGVELQIDDLEHSLYAAKLISYAQGFLLMKRASQSNHWDLNLATIASVWRAGCIIRSVFLNKIMEAYQQDLTLDSLLHDDFFIDALKRALASWKKTVAMAATCEFALPAHAAALNYFYSMTTRELPSNMIQAQRDLFGAHTFERVDAPRGEFFHVEWEK